MPGVPLSFQRPDGSRVAVARIPFALGSGPEDDLRLVEPGVRAGHARLRTAHGDWLLTAEDGCHLHVNGKRSSFMVLGHGDRVRLGTSTKATELVFEDAMAGSFVPPGLPRWRAWLGHPMASSPAARPPTGAGEGSTSFGIEAPSGDVGIAGGGRGVLKFRRPRPLDDESHAAWIELLQRLCGAPHPGLAFVHDGGLHVENGRATPWLLARWVPGRPLVRAALGVVQPARVVAWMAEAAQALAHLHARGLMHRDVTPDNLVLTPDGHVVVIDFGQTRPTDRPLPASHGVVGTPGFVAPEEVLHGAEAAGPAVDVYGLAAVGYHLLVGRPPAVGGDVLDALAGATRRPPTPRSLGVDLPPALEGALLEGLEPDPARRPSMDVFARALDLTRVLVGL